RSGTPCRKTVGRMVTTGRPDHASACLLATFVCVFFLGPALLRGGLASIGPAGGEAAKQEFSIGAGSGKAEGFPPGALGGGVSAEAEIELADHRVPTGITGGDAFRRHGGQALEAGLRAVQVSFGDRAVEAV